MLSKCQEMHKSPKTEIVIQPPSVKRMRYESEKRFTDINGTDECLKIKVIDYLN